jgi:subtilase family serine protease
VQAYVDDSHLIAESDETNNTLNKSLTVGTPPLAADLVVTALSWTPAHPAAGNVVLFRATIKNQGTAATPAGVVHGVGFLVDGTNVAFSDTDTASLAAGASTTLTANGSNAGPARWAATRGKHTVKAWVDDQNRIAESNESNNTTSLPLAVYRSSAPAAVRISTGTLRAGTVNSLNTADGASYQVNSTSSATRTTTWSATVANIPNTTAGLQVTYKGSDSANASQTLSVFNYATNAWVTARTSAVGPAAVTSVVVPTGTPADYVSGTSGNGSVKVRLKTINTTTSFYTSGDQLSVGYL